MRDDDGRGRQVDKGDSTHPMRQATPKMPWHSDDKPFGVSQEDWENVKEDFGIALSVPDGYARVKAYAFAPIATANLGHDYCHCGRRGCYLLDRWYCEECWNDGDDEDEQLDYGGHA